MRGGSLPTSLGKRIVSEGPRNVLPGSYSVHSRTAGPRRHCRANRYFRLHSSTP
jgi:hypothetical protein